MLCFFRLLLSSSSHCFLLHASGSRDREKIIVCTHYLPPVPLNNMQQQQILLKFPYSFHFIVALLSHSLVQLFHLHRQSYHGFSPKCYSEVHLRSSISVKWLKLYRHVTCPGSLVTCQGRRGGKIRSGV